MITKVKLNEILQDYQLFDKSISELALTHKISYYRLKKAFNEVNPILYDAGSTYDVLVDEMYKKINEEQIMHERIKRI